MIHLPQRTNDQHEKRRAREDYQGGRSNSGGSLDRGEGGSKKVYTNERNHRNRRVRRVAHQKKKRKDTKAKRVKLEKKRRERNKIKQASAVVIRKFPGSTKFRVKVIRGGGGTLCSVAIESMKSCRVEDLNQGDLRGTRRWEGKRSTRGASWKREEEEELKQALGDPRSREKTVGRVEKGKQEGEEVDGTKGDRVSGWWTRKLRRWREGKEQVYRDKKERGLSVCAVFLSSVPERE